MDIDAIELDDDAAGQAQDRHFVTALARGLEVLSCFRRGETALSNSEIASRCKLARSTVSRLTYTLTKSGYLHQVPETGAYRHGSAMFALASSALAAIDIRNVARPGMREIAIAANASVGLGVRDRLSMRYIECCKSESPIGLTLDAGSRISMARSAMGRAYLAVCDNAERSEILTQLKEQDRAAWPHLRDSIDKSLQEYARIGCAASFGEWEPNIIGIAVGFRPGGGLGPMSLNCGAVAMLSDPDFLMKEMKPKLQALASELGTMLGG
ncbi:MAG: IclR family transcriptional regulator [Mesorhizobium sp.]|nr:IclR family transcriptional regulator [Mesorhizobium sp.]